MLQVFPSGQYPFIVVEVLFFRPKANMDLEWTELKTPLERHATY